MWEALLTDLLELIVRKLSYPDAVRFSVVCTSWLRAAKTSEILSQPLLQLFTWNEKESSRLTLNLFSLEEDKLSRDVANAAISLRENYCDFLCIGSSKGMSVLINKKTPSEIVVIDPFSRETLYFPAFSLLDLKNPLVMNIVILELAEKKDRVLAFTYCLVERIKHCVYCMAGARQWETLGEGGRYLDMVAKKRRLFLLSDSFSVEAWDFIPNNNGGPSKVMNFIPSNEIMDHWPSFRWSQWSYSYLVESKGELFLVRRLIGWNIPGPYKTFDFQVYKSCLGGGEEWERVESLGDDIAFFIGRNESASLSGWKGNSIYFTDLRHLGNEWHFATRKFFEKLDMGVYCLKQKTIKYFDMHDSYCEDGQLPIWMLRT